jgi:serine O-acetyltransferase
MDALKIWSEIEDEAKKFADEDSHAGVFLQAHVFPYKGLGEALSFRLAEDLACDDDEEGFSDSFLKKELEKVFQKENILAGVIKDLRAVKKRDPASQGYLLTLLFSKGFLALQSHRAASNFAKLEKNFYGLLFTKPSIKNLWS